MLRPPRPRAACASGSPHDARSLGKAEIEAIIPHRDPFLLVDEVLELVPGERVVARQHGDRGGLRRALSRATRSCPGVKMVEALAQCGAVAVLSQPENRGKLVLFAGIDDVRFKRIVRPGRGARPRCARSRRCAARSARARCARRSARELAVRGTLTFAVGEVIGRANGRPISITGLGCHVPERVVTNDELATLVDTNDEWIRDRTGIRERRIAADTEAMSDISLPGLHGKRSRWRASSRRSIDLLIVATITPDMAFPATAALLADVLGHAGRGRLRPLGRLHRASCTRSPRPTACSPRASRSARSWSAATSSRGCSTGPTARRSSSSATAPARSCSSRSSAGGFLGFELGADGSGGTELTLPGERLAASSDGETERSCR